jgi:hypothetical protein
MCDESPATTSEKKQVLLLLLIFNKDQKTNKNQGLLLIAKFNVFTYTTTPMYFLSGILLSTLKYELLTAFNVALPLLITAHKQVSHISLSPYTPEVTCQLV